MMMLRSRYASLLFKCVHVAIYSSRAAHSTGSRTTSRFLHAATTASGWRTPSATLGTPILVGHRHGIRSASSLSGTPSPENNRHELLEFSVTVSESVDTYDGDMLVLPFYSPSPVGAAAKATSLISDIPLSLPNELRTIIGDVINERIFTAEKNTEFVFPMSSADRKFKFITLVGMGDYKDSADDRFYLLGRQISVLSSRLKAGHVGVVLGSGHREGDVNVQDIVHGIHEAAYEDVRFRKVDCEEAPKNILSSLSIFPAGIDLLKSPVDSSSTAHSHSVASGVKLARDLVGAPANKKTPPMLAQVARDIAKEFKMECNILGEEECRARGMGAYLSVQQGSKFPPQFLHLTYKPPPKVGQDGVEKKNAKIVLIGKGLTFDSGGYNLKVGASSIEMMKIDMGGCGAVLGCAKAIGRLQPDNVEVHFISAVCENMISENAVRPGDVVTASNGKTIEVVNTDAEGRLTLADALVYAQTLGEVDAVIDLATLTGAVIVGLGDKVAGLYSSDKKLLGSLLTAAESSGEKVWPLPLEDSYRERIKSPIANIQNVGGSGGAGSITAALFLQEFVEKGTPWAHIDIAGPVWDDKDNKPTGFGVKMLVNYIMSYHR